MIVLTGATGFLGSHVLKSFLNRKFSVICIKRRNSSMDKVKKIKGQCDWIDVECLEDAFRKEPVDMIVHCATTYGRRENVIDVYESNVGFPIQLLKCAKKYGCGYFVNTDTFFTKAFSTGNFITSDTYMGDYVKSKMMFREILRNCARNEGFTIANLQLEHCYGPGDGEDKFVPWLLSKLKQNVQAIELTKGEQKRDWIYVDDVAEAFCTVAEKIKMIPSAQFQCYEVGTGQAVSVKDFTMVACHVLGSKTRLLFGKKEMQKNELMYSCADNTNLFELGWKPQVDLENGILRTTGKI